MDSIYRWINDPEVNKYVEGYLPMTKEAEAEWIDRMSKNEDIILAMETLEGRHIGSMGMHNIKWKDRTATTGAMIGEKDCWGKGYGTDAKMIFLNYAFNTLNLRKISSSVFSFNKRSIAYSLKCGYEVEGVLKRQKFVNGRYYDEVLLGVFKEGWRSLWREYKKGLK
ncbi:MAG: N-acetyltransferase [Parcubacteria group bacterium CG10_big_fil_rev_8_21_14_0_10_38_31]|nr:MAG: N-acetyltransferase [Parcubacteria group bacterium CG10_big_fil_rev_8_21_14_0_10_38_31]